MCYCVIDSFLTDLWISGILFPTAARAVVVAMLRGISSLSSSNLAIREALVAKLVISAMYLQSFLLNHLVYMSQQEQLIIYQHLIYLLYFSDCLNHLVYFSIY